ncbi:MAG: hypothetical protein ABI165_06875 [Bryobacteraceae bacterium]
MTISPESVTCAGGLPGVSPATGGLRLETALKGRWGRLLIPSLSDLFFVAVLGWLFVSGAGGWMGLLADGDTGWHIRTGEYILDHHSVPHTDLYSFSKPDAPWFAWEWLSDVAFALAFRAGGLKGVVLLAGVTISLFAVLLLRWMIWSGAGMFVALLVGLLSVGAASVHFLARPHVFTMLFLVVSLWLVAADRRVRSARVWWLLPLAALWTNLHGGFLVLIVCLGLLAAGSGIEGWLYGAGGPRRWTPFWRYLGLTGATAAATLVNPYGIGLHRHILQYLQSDWIRNVVQEFQSPSFRNENVRQYEILLLAGLVTAGLLLRRRSIVEFLWIVTFAHLSLTSVRHATIFVTIAAPLIAVELARGWALVAGKAPRRSVFLIFDSMARDLNGAFRRASVWPVVVVLALVAIDKPIAWPADFPALTFPVGIVNRHGAEIVRSRIFTEDQWADYLIYRFYPREHVFIDGRSDFYGSALGNEYLQLVQGNYRWAGLLTRYRFDMALIPVEWPLSQLLKLDPGWRVVEDDGHAILFATRLPGGDGAHGAYKD